MVSFCINVTFYMLNFRPSTLSAGMNWMCAILECISLPTGAFPNTDVPCSMDRFTVNVLCIEGIILHATLYVTDD